MKPMCDMTPAELLAELEAWLAVCNIPTGNHPNSNPGARRVAISKAEEASAWLMRRDMELKT